MFNVLLVEDEKNIRNLYAMILSDAGYHVATACDGRQALEMMERQQPDLLITDVMMPVMDGYTLAQALREKKDTLPILMITAKDKSLDRKQGFVVGTDDYMVKPVDEEELLLRVAALLRRAKIANDRKIRIGEVEINYDKLTVRRGAEAVQLVKKEFMLLFTLCSYPNKIFTKNQLLDKIWGMDCESSDATVTVHINRLKSKLLAFPEIEIVAVRGLGYKAVKA